MKNASLLVGGRIRSAFRNNEWSTSNKCITPSIFYPLFYPPWYYLPRKLCWHIKSLLFARRDLAFRAILRTSCRRAKQPWTLLPKRVRRVIHPHIQRSITPPNIYNPSSRHVLPSTQTLLRTSSKHSIFTVRITTKSKTCTCHPNVYYRYNTQLPSRGLNGFSNSVGSLWALSSKLALRL